MRALIIFAGVALTLAACSDDASNPNYNSTTNVEANGSTDTTTTVKCPEGSTYDADSGKCLDQN